LIYGRTRWLLISSLAVLALPLAIACGDDDDDGAGGSAGSDEDYVAAVCAAQRRFQDTLADLEEELGSDAEEDVVAEAIVEPMEQLVEDMRDADPPADVAERHGQLVDIFEATVDDIRETGTLAAFDTMEEPPPAPAEVTARLDAIAADNEDCQEIGFTFSE
jgi:hypothetical protein